MKDFNAFKETFLKKAVDVVDKTKEIAKAASDKTKTLARITRLTAEMAGDKDVIKQNYTEIGKLYYAKYKDTVNDEFAQLVEEIRAAEERIEAKKAEIEELKAETDDDIEVEFVEEPEGVEVEVAEEVFENVAEEIADVTKETKDAAEEIVEEIKEDAGEQQ